MCVEKQRTLSNHEKSRCSSNDLEVYFFI